MVPDCPGPVYIRGLCRSDYIYAVSLVRYRIASWKELEKAGLVLKTSAHSRHSRRPDRALWFSGVMDGDVDLLLKKLSAASGAYQKEKRRSAS